MQKHGWKADGIESSVQFMTIFFGINAVNKTVHSPKSIQALETTFMIIDFLQQNHKKSYVVTHHSCR